jgi:sugar lactone lactonase YvrE
MKYKTSIIVAILSLLTTSVVHADGKSLVEPGTKVKKLAGGMKFKEGPEWLPDQKKLVFSDIPNSKLMQWSEAGGLSEFRPSLFRYPDSALPGRAFQ